MLVRRILIGSFAILILMFLQSCGSNNKLSDRIISENTSTAETEYTSAAVNFQSLPTFNDVPFDYFETINGIKYPLPDYIQALFENGITSGISKNPPLYGPQEIMDRAHFAIFLLRAAFGGNYLPPEGTWKIFENDDWNIQPGYKHWVNGLYQAQLTNGCQTNPIAFCPNENLTRLHAVIFALRLKFNIYDKQGNLVNLYEPPAATGSVFSDMTDAAFYGTRWAEAAYANNLLPACGMVGDKPLFCPNEQLDRAWAAYIIVQAKDLLP